MRRIDRIRSMSVYEMADAIIEHRADEIPCPSKEECTDYYDAHGELPPGGCRECLIEFKGGKLMRVLEKILQEIEVAIYPAEGIGCGLEDVDITDRYEAAAYGWNEAVERISEIIRSHMEDELVSNSDKLDGDKKEYINIQDERLWDILFEEACVEGEQADRIQEKLLRICISHKLDDGWIPVEERLPEPGVYLVSCDDKEYPVKRMRMKGVCFYDHNGIYDGEIYAWRPLPAPYQPKEEK